MFLKRNVLLLSALPTHRVVMVPALFVAEVEGVLSQLVLSSVRCELLFLLPVLLLLLCRIHLAHLPCYLGFVLDVLLPLVVHSWLVHVW